MTVVLCACILTSIVLVSSAPTIRENVDPGAQDVDYNQRLADYYLRGRRSNKFAVVSPCAAAAALPHYHSPGHYGYGSGYSHYHNAYPYMPVHPGHVYRADEEEPEVMAFSDADTMEAPWARHNYAAIPAVPQEVQSGPAYGVFPNAKGGCAIPLLVSCSPNVVQGRIVKAEPHIYGAPAQVGYRPPDHQYPNLSHHSTMVNEDLPSATGEGSHDAVNTQTQ